MIDQYNVWLIYFRKTMIYLHLFSGLRNPKNESVDLWKIFTRKIIYKNVFLSRIPITYTEIKYAYESKYLNIVVVTFIWKVAYMSYCSHVPYISYSRFNKSQANKCRLDCRLNIFLLHVIENSQLQVYYHDSHGRISDVTKIDNC